MSTTVLATKLFIPSTRPELVSRSRLVEKLNEWQLNKMTLISAPAGFGKTTLVSEWLDKLRLDRTNDSIIENRIAWLSLDESDNDPTRFLTYLIAALNQLGGIKNPLGEGVLSMLQTPQLPPTEDALTLLINDIAAIPDRFILVIDDYHTVESSPVGNALIYLIEHLPQQMHLVIITREDPNLPLARIRSQGQLIELRAIDLRFTDSEAAEFLNKVMGLDLSAENIALLETRTEGWIAGLQLAAISMQNLEDVTSFIESFTGSHHLVLDYLIEEVLEGQPENIQTFLLQTAVLDRFTGSLCDFLTGQDSGQETLEILERTNLFIVPLDNDRLWYRYHHLFSDLLRRRLGQTHLEQTSILHLKASQWYEKNGFSDEAIEHALQAEDFERAVHLIDGVAENVWGRGEQNKLGRWLDRLPAGLVITNPNLSILHAWGLFINGHQEAAEERIQAAEHALESNTENQPESSSVAMSNLSDSELMKFHGRAAVIRAFIAFFQGDVGAIIRYASQALENLPDQDLTWRGTALIALGDAYRIKGDLAAAYQAQSEAVEACKVAGNIYLIMLSSLKVGLILRMQGKLQEAIEICKQQMQLSREYGLVQTGNTGWLLAVWGETLAELNDLDGALQQANKSLELFKGRGNLLQVTWSYMCIVRILFSNGDLASTEEIMQKIENIERKSPVPPWISVQAEAWQVRLWLAQDRLDLASNWMNDRGMYDNVESGHIQEIDHVGLIEYITMARILIAQERVDEATGLLQQLLESAEAGGRISRVIEIMLLQALAFQAEGDTDQSIATLENALALAEPGGFIRIFVDEGPQMGRLLYEALKRDISPEYITQLLAAFPVDELEKSDPLKGQSARSNLVEPLSDREIEVLQLISEGLINQEIGSKLFLSLNTVKAHTRNIYAKLDVNNRTQAVSKARALGILSST